MKSVKNLLVPFIVMVALLIGVIIYLVVSANGNNEPSGIQSGLIDIVYFNSSEINSLSVYNNKTQYNSVIKCTTDSKGYTQYEFLGDDVKPGEKYSQWKISEYVNALIYYSGYAKVSTTSNLAEYGLNNPNYTITINCINGSVTTVYLGNMSPDGKYCYMYFSGSDAVYSISSIKLDNAAMTSIDFLDSIFLNIDYDNLKTVHFDRSTDNMVLDTKAVKNAAGLIEFDVYSPYEHDTSSYFSNLVYMITQLTISEYIDITDADKSKYGLDDPAYHFILTTNDGQKTELYFSQKINGFYYGRMSGMDNYFKVFETMITGLEMQEKVLIDPYVYSYNAKDIKTITGTYGDKTFKFEVFVPEGESMTSSRASFTLDGRNGKISDSDGRSYSSVLFESLTCIEIAGIEIGTDVDTSAGPVISFEFLENSYNTTVYDFYTRDNNSYYVFKDGKYMNFYIFAKELFFDAGTDTYNYGAWSAYELLNEAITNNKNGTYDIPVE